MLCLPVWVSFSSRAQLVSDSLLRQHVGALAHDSMEGRLTGTAGMEKAAAYIAGVFEALGLQAFVQQAGPPMHIPWHTEASGASWSGVNVAALLPGTRYPDSLVVFSAHFDHVGVVDAQQALPFGNFNRRVKGDNIFNGANDNASGVACLLELARLCAEAPWPYSVVFVAFSGEELGLLGSKQFVPLLPADRTLVNVNIEMMGRPGKMRPFLIEPPDPGRLRTRLNAVLRQAGIPQRQYFTADPFPGQDLFRRSDNYSFHEAGIPSYTLMGSSPRDKFYHSTGDNPDTLEYGKMTFMLQSFYNALGTLVFSGRIL